MRLDDFGDVAGFTLGFAAITTARPEMLSESGIRTNVLRVYSSRGEESSVSSAGVDGRFIIPQR